MAQLPYFMVVRTHCYSARAWNGGTGASQSSTAQYSRTPPSTERSSRPTSWASASGQPDKSTILSIGTFGGRDWPDSRRTCGGCSPSPRWLLLRVRQGLQPPQLIDQHREHISLPDVIHGSPTKTSAPFQESVLILVFVGSGAILGVTALHITRRHQPKPSSLLPA